MAITLDQAKSLTYGEILHHNHHTNADGTCERWRVNGKPKTWVRTPGKVMVPLKHGMRDYDYLMEDDLEYMHLEKDCHRKEQ